MAEHTPGPWGYRTNKGVNLGSTGQLSRKPAYVIESQTEPVWIVETNHEANARLIAAAPDLLEAAEIAWKILDSITTKDFELGKDKPARDALQSAITQATGG